MRARLPPGDRALDVSGARGRLAVRVKTQHECRAAGTALSSRPAAPRHRAAPPSPVLTRRDPRPGAGEPAAADPSRSRAAAVTARGGVNRQLVSAHPCRQGHTHRPRSARGVHRTGRLVSTAPGRPLFRCGGRHGERLVMVTPRCRCGGPVTVQATEPTVTVRSGQAPAEPAAHHDGGHPGS